MSKSTDIALRELAYTPPSEVMRVEIPAEVGEPPSRYLVHVAVDRGDEFAAGQLLTAFGDAGFGRLKALEVGFAVDRLG